MRAREFIFEETTTLKQLYGGNYPDRYDDFWDHVRTGEFDIPLTIRQLSPLKLDLMLRDQYRAEHLDEIVDMLSDEQRKIIDRYTNNPNLSNSVILVSAGRIIDGNHRALSAALRKVPIQYVDLSDLEDDQINEIRFEKSDQGFMDMTSDMDRDYKYASSGAYSRVYQHPTQNKTLIKVFKNDRGYAEWLRWMAGHQNNRYVPEIIPHEDGSIIKAYKFFKALPGNQATTQRIGIVNLRKLEIATADQREDFITYVLNYLNEDTHTRILSGKPPARRSINWFDKFTFGTEWGEIAQNSKKKDPDLSSVATEFVRMIKRHGYLDLHNENLMWDPERNNIVFIDVLSVG